MKGCTIKVRSLKIKWKIFNYFNAQKLDEQSEEVQLL